MNVAAELEQVHYDYRQALRNHENRVANFIGGRASQKPSDADYRTHGPVVQYNGEQINSNNGRVQRHATPPSHMYMPQDVQLITPVTVSPNTTTADGDESNNKLKYISWYIQVVAFPGLLLFIIMYEPAISLLTKIYAIIIYAIFVIMLFVNSPHINWDGVSAGGTAGRDSTTNKNTVQMNVIPESLDQENMSREPLIPNDGYLGNTRYVIQDPDSPRLQTKTREFDIGKVGVGGGGGGGGGGNNNETGNNPYMNVMKSVGKILSGVSAIN